MPDCAGRDRHPVGRGGTRDVELTAAIVRARRPSLRIYFDTGKSTLKPESDAAVAEVAKLLKADAVLKVYVVGHTDNVASLDLNVKLSQARADAVPQALVAHGIAADRLLGCGAGPLAPVASNDSEDGRTKNRQRYNRMLWIA
jgi:outer membrane protein OmpA-like peptidoglycan-associated protein